MIEGVAPNPLGAEDRGTGAVTPKPCCARVGEAWCTMYDGHGGEHRAPEHRPLPPNRLDRGRARR